jgi:hypothetical protein
MRSARGPHVEAAVEPVRAPVGVGSRWQLGLSLALLLGWIVFLAITARA